MSEIIQLIRHKNNGRLGSDFLSNQNDHWNSNWSKNRPTCVFIGSFSINDEAIFGCVIDKQYDTLSDLIIIFGTAKNQITFYRPYNFLSIGTQNILIILSVPAYSQTMVAYIVNMFIIWDDQPRIQAIHGRRGNTSLYPSTQIYHGSGLWTPGTVL